MMHTPSTVTSLRRSTRWPSKNIFFSAGDGSCVPRRILCEREANRRVKGLEDHSKGDICDLRFFHVRGDHSLVQAGSLSVSPSLRIPMYYVYALLPLGYFLALIETIRQEVLAIKEFCTKRKEENA